VDHKFFLSESKLEFKESSAVEEAFYGGLQSAGTPVEVILDIYIYIYIYTYIYIYWTQRPLGNRHGGGGHLDLFSKNRAPII